MCELEIYDFFAGEEEGCRKMKGDACCYFGSSAV